MFIGAKSLCQFVHTNGNGGILTVMLNNRQAKWSETLFVNFLKHPNEIVPQKMPQKHAVSILSCASTLPHHTSVVSYFPLVNLLLAILFTEAAYFYLLIPYSHYKPKRSEAKRSEPYCRIRTIHTSTECAAMRIPQFDSFHTAHSRMRFVSHWKRSEAHY